MAKLLTIDLHRAFSLYFQGTVDYVGRAIGKLGPGRFLLLVKNDGSISIHAGSDIPARNYMGSGCKLRIDGSILRFNCKKENITIHLNEIINYHPLLDWSEDKVFLRRTEQELVDKIFHNWNDYIDADVEIIEKEYLTKYGPVDILGLQADFTHHVVEVKRRKTTISDVGQLRRYVEVFEEQFDTKGYLASPEIGEKAVAYLEKHGYQWIQVDFDDLIVLS